jgi:O-antigen/teichoic acid export membrane protein
VGGDAKIEQDEVLEPSAPVGLADQVKGAVLWRSGSQIVSQLITWAATFLVIRLLDPRDYGLLAMTTIVLTFLNLLNGYGFANALIRDESIDRRKIAQVFGMLILLNGGLAALQLAMAPVAAAYFRQPIVADLLRVQCLLYLCTPFLALPHALLSRSMDFRRMAQVDLVAALACAVTGLACAWAGLGVWTLVFAPLSLFATRAVLLTIAARSLIWPSFRFAGAGAMFRYGGTMVLVQFFWFIQSQSDVFIGGRLLTPHDLGLYTTALFLATIMAAKFVPPLNDVAFAAYARMQTDREAVASSFAKAMRLIMLIALPFYFGLAATAEPLVLTVLGDKWVETVPLVRTLAMAMPFMTIQILFAPATNALGRPDISLKVALLGAALLPIAFLVGIRFGTQGMAIAWLAAFPVLTLATAFLSLPTIGVRASALAAALAPGLAASTAMIVPVLAVDAALPLMEPIARLALLVPVGAVTYGALLFLFARGIVEELFALVRRRAAPAGA